MGLLSQAVKVLSNNLCKNCGHEIGNKISFAVSLLFF